MRGSRPCTGQHPGLMTFAPPSADGGRHGNDDPEHPRAPAALRVAAPQLAGCAADLGRQLAALSCCTQFWFPGWSVGCPPAPAAAKGSAEKNQTLHGNTATSAASFPPQQVGNQWDRCTHWACHLDCVRLTHPKRRCQCFRTSCLLFSYSPNSILQPLIFS